MKRLFLAAWASTVLVATAHAEIVIGQTTVLTGGAAANVAEVNLGAKLVFDAVNAAGGIKGQRIRLVSLDDAAQGSAAAANADKLITEHKAVALFLSRSTPTALAMRDVLTRHGVPLVAPSTGAMAIRRPVHPYIYNLRSSYQAETRKAVETLSTMGLAHDIGIIAVDDPFGDDALQGAYAGFQSVGPQPVRGQTGDGADRKLAPAKPLFVERFDYATSDVTKGVARVREAGARAVLIIGSTKPTVAAIKEIKKAGTAAPALFTISNNASESFITALGRDGAGVVVTQVFPRESAVDIPLVRDATAMLNKEKPGARLTAAVLEGVAAARLLVGALNNVSGPVTARALVNSLDSGTSFDIGWPNMSIRYTSQNHDGINFADTSIVTDTGKFRR